MPLDGREYLARELNELAYKHGWRDAHENVRCVAVCFAESAGRERAYNDNRNETDHDIVVAGHTYKPGEVTSRDVGLMEINIPAHQIGTDVEEALYDPDNNFAAARKLFVARGWQPWFAFKNES